MSGQKGVVNIKVQTKVPGVVADVVGQDSQGGTEFKGKNLIFPFIMYFFRRGFGGPSRGFQGRERSRERQVYKRRRSPSFHTYKIDYKELSTSPESDKNFTLPKEIEKKRKGMPSSWGSNHFMSLPSTSAMSAALSQAM